MNVAVTPPYQDFEDFDHTGPGTLMGRYLRRFWQPVQIASELPAGWAKPIKVMSEDYTLYRGQSGTPYLVDFHCAHRSTQLSLGWVEGETINCRYHGWAYDGDGQCVSMPAETHPFCEKVKLKSWPVREYGGLIFAYLGEGEPPEFQRYPALESADSIINPYGHYFDYNTYNNLENDPLHFPYAHRGLVGGAFVGVPPRVTCTQSPWGIAVHLDYGNSRPAQVMQWGFPNVSNIPGGTAVGADARMGVWTEHISWKVPIDDVSGCHYLVMISHVPAENREEYLKGQAERAKSLDTGKHRPHYRELAQEILKGRVRIDDITADDVSPAGGLGLILLQDVITQGGQGTVQRDRRKERLGKHDSFIVMFRKLLMTDLKALSEGRPIANWHFDPVGAAISPKGTVTPEMTYEEVAAKSR